MTRKVFFYPKMDFLLYLKNKNNKIPFTNNPKEPATIRELSVI